MTGSPGSPMDMSITKTSSDLTIQWSEGDVGEASVTGYTIEARPSGEHEHSRGSALTHLTRIFLSSVLIILINRGRA